MSKMFRKSEGGGVVEAEVHATPSKETWTAMVMGDVMLSYLGHPSSLHIKTLRRTPREDPSHHLKELGSDLGQEDEDRSISEGRRREKTRGDRERQEVMAGGRGGAGRFPGAPRQGTSYSEGGGIQNGLTRPTRTKDRGKEEVRALPPPPPIISHGAPSRRETRLSDGKALSANGIAPRAASQPIERRAQMRQIQKHRERKRERGGERK